MFCLLMVVCSVRNWFGLKVKVLCSLGGMCSDIVIDLVVLGWMCEMVRLWKWGVVWFMVLIWFEVVEGF